MLSTLGPIKYHFSFILIRLNSRSQDIQLADCSVPSNWQWGALKRDKTPQGGSDVTRTWKRSERVSHEQQWEQGEQNREHGGDNWRERNKVWVGEMNGGKKKRQESSYQIRKKKEKKDEGEKNMKNGQSTKELYGIYTNIKTGGNNT